MITPASVGDWALLAGLLGLFGSSAVVASRWIHNDPEADREAASNPIHLVWTQQEIDWEADRHFGKSLVGHRAL